MRIKMPAVRIAQADSESGSGSSYDLLTCGVCKKPFIFDDFNKFIQHKAHACRACCIKESNSGEQQTPPPAHADRRPSISAPIKNKSAPPPRPPLCSSPDSGSAAELRSCSTPKRERPRSSNSSASPTPIKVEQDDVEDGKSPPPGEASVKQELVLLDSTTVSPRGKSAKKARVELADAQSNTTQTEPSQYICSTCKFKFDSAWQLLQHVQNSHGLNLYVEAGGATSSDSSISLGSSGPNNVSNVSSSPFNSTGSYGGQGPHNIFPMHPRLPILPSMEPHNPFSVGGLLRLPEPIRHHPYSPALNGLPHHPHHHRSASHRENPFHVENIVSEQFRFNQHHLNMAAAVAASAGMPSPYATSPLDRRALISSHSSNEPHADFYSQRLRQLAGGSTSPNLLNGSKSLSPRKLTPPFSSPGSAHSQPLLAMKRTPSPRVASSPLAPAPNNNNNSSTLNNNVSGERSSETDSHESIDLSVNKSDKASDCATQSNVIDIEKKKECEYCGKKFRFQSNLVVHKRIHTKEKPYRCTVCDHACAQSSKLKRHMKIHRSSNKTESANSGEGTKVDGSAARNVPTPEREDEDSEEEDEEEDEEEKLEENEEEEEVDEDDEDDDMEEDEGCEENEDEEEEDMDVEDEEEEGVNGEDTPEDLTTKSSSNTEDEKSSERSSSRNSEKVAASDSLVGELIDKFGLSNFQQYTEAYKQAMGQSGSLFDEKMQQIPLIGNNNNGAIKRPLMPIPENGISSKAAAALFGFRGDKFSKSLPNSGNSHLDMMTASQASFLAASGMPFENFLDIANRRMKFDINGLRGSLMNRNGAHPDVESMYPPGLWLPAMAAANSHRREVYGSTSQRPEIPEPHVHRTRKANLENRLHGAKLAAPGINLGLTSQQLKKDTRRNDTCEYCGKVFKNCSNLTVHRRSHTGEKPYKCELCAYACAQSSKLTRHMKTHGRCGKDVYRCRFCEMPFSVPSTLEKHMRKCVVNQGMKNAELLTSSMQLIKCEPSNDSSKGASSL